MSEQYRGPTDAATRLLHPSMSDSDWECYDEWFEIVNPTNYDSDDDSYIDEWREYKVSVGDKIQKDATMIALIIEWAAQQPSGR